jgi:hypothetical protein
MPLRFTPLMQKRLTRRAQAMLERSLSRFPELHGKTITVGLTRKHLGSASISYHSGTISRLVIRLRVRKVTYQTIGHELTHLVQGLAHGDRPMACSPVQHRIPSGEKQCDIWTLARDFLFCDDPPTYLRMPRVIRECWPDYAEEIRHLCIAAIEKRRNHRLYIRWLESEIRKLPSSKPLSRAQGPTQLFLPLGNTKR